MRLYPKSIFLGIVAVGLPFAVTAGWMLGAPAARQVALPAPAGDGGLGSAPTGQVRATTTAPVGEITWYPREQRPVAVIESAVTVPASSPAGATAVVTTPASPTPTVTGPVLTLPPVPTPTSASPSPSPTPSASQSTEPEPSDDGFGGLFKRR